ncbi:MAG: hypothetical protein CVV33_01285 [Methanomicrobiales archaeon HGW-Methanomicrobiales-4]|nr:MAG: hypothetical protein CVV33_01285 [Methanomicrobiales archaeon HGW-Methanomicrobiales-4]
MQLSEFFEADDVRLVEPLFSDLCYTEMDELLLRIPGNQSRILIDEDDEVLSLAVESPAGLIHASCFHLRSPSDTLISRFEEMDGEVYQIPRDQFEDGVREYYSEALLSTSVVAQNDLNPARLAITRDLVKSVIGDERDLLCLDCCCGSGIGSSVLTELGQNPLSYDNDESLLARGLKDGRLRPERTMWIDGTLLDQYLNTPVDIAFGFMFGEIQPFNQDIWAEIISAICSVSDKIMLTVGTKPEADLIEGWLQEAGLEPEIWENDRDPIYDRWVCSAV